MTKKRLISLLAFVILIGVLLGGGIYVRNVILRQVSKRIQSYVNYSAIHLRVFPPAIVLDDIQTVSASPLFSAKRVAVELPFDSLFKRNKPLVIFVDQPVVKVSKGREEAKGKAKSKGFFSLPFALAKVKVRDGQFYYQGVETSYQATGIRAIFEQKAEGHSLRADVERSSLLLQPGRKSFDGKISLLVDSIGNQVQVKKLSISGPEIIVKAKGNMTNLSNPEGTLRISWKAEMDAIAGILKIPFSWGGRTQGEGDFSRMQKEIVFKTSFNSDDLVFNRIPWQKVRGQVEYSPKNGTQVELNVFPPSGSAEFIRIGLGAGKVRGELQGFRLDPILSQFSLPWPVLSPMWGNFSVDEKELAADFEFRDDDFVVVGDKYPIRGPVHFTWDKKKEIAFSSPKLNMAFGDIELNGKVNLESTYDISIKGVFSDVKGSREFAQLVLRETFAVPEIRGSGAADVLVTGDIHSPRVKIDFDLSPAGYDLFDISAAQGTVELANKTVRGLFLVNDPQMKGQIQLFSEKGNLNAKIQFPEASVEKVLTGLNLKAPLTGTASGDFEVNSGQGNLEVNGKFVSPLIKLAGFDLRDVTGKLRWDGNLLSFPELSFALYGGRITGSLGLGFKSPNVAIDLAGQKVDLSLLTPALTGELALNLKGNAPMGGEIASGGFEIKGLQYSHFQAVDVRGDLKVRLSDQAVGLSTAGNFLPGENDFSIDAGIPLSQDGLSLDIKGSFGNLDILLPWKGAKGRLNYLAEVRGPSSSPQINGGIDFQGSIVPFPQFSQALTDYSGFVILKNNAASLRSFKGKLGGGDLEASGEINFGRGALQNLSINIEGKNMALSPFERTRALADTSLILIKDPARFILTGDFIIHRLLWRREISERLVFSSSPYLQAQRRPGFLDSLNLNLHLRADDNVWLENSLGRMRGRFDLNLTGNVKSPILLGDIEALGGTFNFQDRKFQVLQGRVSFFNPSSAEPYIEFKGETYVKDYRVTFAVTGLPDNLKPEFSSSPPLPSEDVLALLSLGESFKRTYSTETTTQQSSASLLSFNLMEAAQKGAQTIFSLDRFRIDPFLMSSSAEMTARLTVGKSISKDFFVTYSTNLTRTNMDQIIRLEWDLSNDFSLVGTRNELGRISVDFKIRKRF
jgi:TamB, inner membrane protein subunit of TAM complex